jgi:hypothetical protein
MRSSMQTHIQNGHDEPPNAPLHLRRWRHPLNEVDEGTGKLPKSRPAHRPRQRRQCASGCWTALSSYSFVNPLLGICITTPGHTSMNSGISRQSYSSR